jgi:hypothetical protein
MSRRDEDDRLRLTVRVPPDQIERVKRRFANGRHDGQPSHGGAGDP